MDWKLEVVSVPVSDVDRAKAFYSEQVGFGVDLDTQLGDGMRLVQLTPPGSGCSIHLHRDPEHAARDAGGLAARRLRHRGRSG